MNKKLILVVLLVWLLSGCSVFDQIFPTGTPTAVVEASAPDLDLGATVQAAVNATLSLTATPTPGANASAPTATPEPAPLVQLPAAIEATEAPVPTAMHELFLSPVECRDSFNQESSWLICEPGVILDNSTAWVIPSTKEVWYSNVPEGAFAYYSLGQGKIAVDGYTIDLPYEEGNNYLVLIRGRIDDGKVDTDRNLTAQVTDFVPGHAIFSYMPKGAYVSHDWFLQQLFASTSTGFTNCGGLGCSQATVVLFDVDSHFEQRFLVQASDLSKWERIK
jgi:hypothetical protein